MGRGGEICERRLAREVLAAPRLASRCHELSPCPGRAVSGKAVIHQGDNLAGAGDGTCVPQFGQLPHSFLTGLSHELHTHHRVS